MRIRVNDYKAIDNEFPDRPDPEKMGLFIVKYKEMKKQLALKKFWK